MVATPVQNKLKVIITDDHRIVRAGIKQIVEDCPEMAPVDEASDGQELLAKVRKNHYDAILLDLSMPGRDGLEILKQLKSEKCKAPVLILSVHPEEQYAIRALKSGAAGYLTNSTAPEELIEAIKKISAGKKYITPALADHLAANIDSETDKPLHERLSDREL